MNSDHLYTYNLAQRLFHVLVIYPVSVRNIVLNQYSRNKDDL